VKGLEKSNFEEEVKKAFWEEGKKPQDVALRASELEKRILKKIGISRATFYRRLDELVEKGFLLKDETKRRNTIYHLNYSAMLLKQEVLSYINEAMKPFETQYMKGKEEIKDEARLLRELGYQIAKVSLWALLKQIETGEPYTEIACYYLSYIGGAQALLKRTIIQREAPYLELEKRIAFSDPKVAFGDLPDFQPALDRYEAALKSLYPKNGDGVEELDALDSKVREGKSSFKIQKGA
jgi:Fe2+ or Zn2+ uptake regulation protein